MELKLALIQMSVTGDKTADLRRACEAVRKAGKVDMAVLPEMFCCPYDTACFRDYATKCLRVLPLDNGRTDLVLREF